MEPRRHIPKGAIRALLWKQWLEQYWKLIFASVVLGGYTVIALKSRLLPDMEALVIGSGAGGLLLPIFVSMGLIAPEREDGSLETLLVLPVSGGLIYVLKLAVGGAVCVGPLLVSGGIAAVLAGGREISVYQVLWIYLAGMILAMILLVWMVGVNVRQRSEARAGLVSLVLVLMWIPITLIIFQAVRSSELRKQLLHLYPMEIFDLSISDNAGTLDRFFSFFLLQGLLGVVFFVIGLIRFQVTGKRES